MIGVYFDSQIFRYLKDPERYPEPKRSLYKKLKTYIDNNKPHFLYFYSHAHLLDLKNDDSQRKYDDLEFMGSVVQDNLLMLFAKENYPQYLLVKPLDAYKEYMEGDFSVDDLNFKDIFNVDQYKEYLDEEQYNRLKTSADLLKALTVSDVMPDLGADIPIEQHKALAKFLPINKPSLSYIDYLNQFLKFGEDFQTDTSIYKDLRGMVTTNKEVKFTIDLSTFDFSMDYQDTHVQKKFLDFVAEQMGKKDYNQFDLHYQAYISLDILGVEKESNKRLKTQNLLNDAHHSYYAGFCDLVVSDDTQLREKTKILFKLFGVNTRVLTVEEFINELFWINMQIDYREQNFWDKMVGILNNGFVKRILKPYPNRDVFIYNSSQFFLSYFNEMRQINEGNDSYIVLRHEVKNYYGNSANFKTIQAVTNKSIDLFGLDDVGLGYFNYELETNEVNVGNWGGRTWRRDSIEIILEINSSLGKLNLVICL